MTTLPDLPLPAIVEVLAYDTIKAALIADYVALDPAFDALLESDPVAKLLEVAAYRELLLRHRINQAARANLLAFARGTDLDHLALFYGVERLSGETDEPFRLRIRERIIGWSTAGAAPSYRYHVLSAHPGIEDASVSSPEAGLVVVALLPRVDADADEVLAAARARAEDPAVRVLTDALDVRMATALPVTVAARIWLRPDAPDSRLAELDAHLRAALGAERRLGWDVTRSWLSAQLHRSGVYRLELDAPSADVVVAPDAYARVDAVTLTLAGRGA